MKTEDKLTATTTREQKRGETKQKGPEILHSSPLFTIPLVAVVAGGPALGGLGKFHHHNWRDSRRGSGERRRETAGSSWLDLCCADKVIGRGNQP